MGFIERMMDKARSDKKTIVLPESYEPRTIEACARILEQGIADIVLIGNREKIQAVSPQWDISGARVIDPATSPDYENFVQAFYELRKAKGVTLEKARETMLDPLFYGVMMVRQQQADGMVAGAINSTANTLRPALQILKTAPGTKLVSSFMIMVVPDCEFGANGTFLFADCGLCENPNAEELSEIAVASAATFRNMTGIEPNVAMLSYSTYGSAKSDLTNKVIEATRLAKAKAPDLNLDGELQLDAAIVGSVGKSKAPGSTVAGQANVLIFPDLNAGNIGYKLVQRLAKAEAYGPVTQGIARPVNDLSRGCSADDIVGVVAITAVQAQAY
ncbi:MAG TPA: phosphate acetyltransferase [Clostridiales bacterium]|nr:phosphate acetyltransferase [Clostridiales bacterium]